MMAAAAAVLVVSGTICSMTMRTNEIEILEETKTIYMVNGLVYWTKCGWIGYLLGDIENG